jgi:hypothetical protein
MEISKRQLPLFASLLAAVLVLAWCAGRAHAQGQASAPELQAVLADAAAPGTPLGRRYRQALRQYQEALGAASPQPGDGAARPGSPGSGGVEKLSLLDPFLGDHLSYWDPLGTRDVSEVCPAFK